MQRIAYHTNQFEALNNGQRRLLCNSLVARVSESGVHTLSMCQLILAPALLAAAACHNCCTAAHAEQRIANQAVLIMPLVERSAAYLSAYKQRIGSRVCLQHITD